MLYLIIRLPQQRFNPFRFDQAEIFHLYNDAKMRSKKEQSHYVHYENSQEKAQILMQTLASQLSRFIVLEMLVKSRFMISDQFDGFRQSINRADFYRGVFHHPLPVRQDTRQSAPAAASPSPFSQVPTPDSSLQKKAKEAAIALGDALPQECMDPISMETLEDPIEINTRVYNRSSLVKMLKGGQFHDPFTREIISPSAAKPAHYMLDALVQHQEVLAGNKPALFNDATKNSEVVPLKELFELWEKSLPSPNSPTV